MTDIETMHPQDLTNAYQPGDPHSWAEEFRWLRENHAAKLRALFHDVLKNGIREPVLLGDDGRLWDGHHRLYVANALGFTSIRAKHARPEGQDMNQTTNHEIGRQDA